MNKRTKFRLLQSLFYWAIFFSLLLHCYLEYHGSAGVLLFFILWSFYIICIPGGHGQILFGFPLRRLTGYDIYPEIILWPSALIINVITYLFNQELYTQNIFTLLLYRIISTPNPYWLIIAISGCGTFYYFIIKEKFFAPSSIKNRVIRHLLILTGIVYFCIATHREFILLLNATA